jgi:hypothetical protein
MGKVNRITREAAERLAIQALDYLSAEPERLARFLALSGLDPRTIRSAARDPQFLAGVLEYVASDEALLVAFAEHIEMPPGYVAGSRNLLSGQPREREIP